MFCTRCGAKLPDNASFCVKCGARLGRADVGSDTETPALKGAKAAATPEQKVLSVETATVRVGGGIGPVAKRDKSKLAAIVVVAVVVVAVVGAVVYFSLFASYGIDEGAFPDQTLRTYVSNKLDSDRDGKLSRDEAQKAKKVDLSKSDVADLKGIGFLSNLEELDLSKCEKLNSVDLSANGKLVKLNLADSSVAAVDATPLSELNNLDITGCGISELNLSRCPHLKTLEAAGSKLRMLDVSANRELAKLGLPEETRVAGLESAGMKAEYQLVEADMEGVLGVMMPSAAQAPLAGSLKVTFKYNADHQLESETDEYDGEQSSFNASRVYIYGKNGLLDGFESKGSGSSGSNPVHYTYDGDGRLTGYGSGSSEHSITWDDNGRIIGIDKRQLSYDAQGRLIEVKSEPGVYITTYGFEYDNEGRISKSTLTVTGARDTDSTYDEYTYDYDRFGHCVGINGIRRNYSGAPSAEYHAAFGYDEAGNLVHSEYSGGEGRNAQVTFEYDEVGNMVKRTISNSSPNLDSGKMGQYKTGTATFKYRRSFTEAGNPDYFDASAAFLANPSYQTFIKPFELNPLQGQDPLVRQHLHECFPIA